MSTHGSPRTPAPRFEGAFAVELPRRFEFPKQAWWKKNGHAVSLGNHGLTVRTQTHDAVYELRNPTREPYYELVSSVWVRVQVARGGGIPLGVNDNIHPSVDYSAERNVVVAEPVGEPEPVKSKSKPVYQPDPRRQHPLLKPLTQNRKQKVVI